ncbi:MAG: O-acetyl-ADP-ribose deacetylase [Rhodospirillales bacterium]|nr:O-acetyl-ADP-ribose deacetylase [Rhodospirillales bacterium]
MSRLYVHDGDITLLTVDAIVNAANETLLGGGGVDGAIHRAAGSQLLEDCKSLGGCPTGEARVTKGYGLPARWIIHTVGPVWHGGGAGEDALLASCYRRCLEEAGKLQARSLAYPCISTGVYGFPLERAARIAIATVTADLARHDCLESVIFVTFGAEAFEIYRGLLPVS